MFGIGPQELILILVGALIIFGPQRLPEIAGQVGKAIRDFRRMSDDLTGEFQRSISLEEQKPNPPVLASETSTAESTPNGIGDTIAQSLRVEQVPAEESTAAEATPQAIAETPEPVVAQSPQDLVISLAPVATKADPLVGVSLLDDPTPYVGPTSKGRDAATEIPTEEATGEATPADGSVGATSAALSYVYEPTPIPESSPLALDAAPEPTNEADAVRSSGGIADAWDAVLSTEATASVAVVEPPVEEADTVLADNPAPLYPAGTYPAESTPYPEPERPTIDPAAEPTIREKIEAQVAAEAFRERRRIAHYARNRGKRSE